MVRIPGTLSLDPPIPLTEERRERRRAELSSATSASSCEKRLVPDPTPQHLPAPASTRPSQRAHPAVYQHRFARAIYLRVLPSSPPGRPPRPWPCTSPSPESLPSLRASRQCNARPRSCFPPWLAAAIDTE